jgi:hypothetical protein
MSDSAREVLTEVLSASAGGIISSSALFPLEMVKTRMQSATSAPAPPGSPKKPPAPQSAPSSPESTASPSPPPPAGEAQPVTALSTAREIYAAGGGGLPGVLSFWSSFHFSAAQSAVEKGLYFLAFTALKNGYKELARAEEVNATASLALGAAAEWCHLPFSLPLDVMTTKLATDRRYGAPPKRAARPPSRR